MYFTVISARDYLAAVEFLIFDKNVQVSRSSRHLLGNRMLRINKRVQAQTSTVQGGTLDRKQ